MPQLIGSVFGNNPVLTSIISYRKLGHSGELEHSVVLPLRAIAPHIPRRPLKYQMIRLYPALALSAGGEIAERDEMTLFYRLFYQLYLICDR